MRSERAEHNRDARHSGLWTAVGWLVFALPFGLYMILQLATLWGLRVHFGG